jgi:hypothetical protein
MLISWLLVALWELLTLQPAAKCVFLPLLGSASTSARTAEGLAGGVDGWSRLLTKGLGFALLMVSDVTCGVVISQQAAGSRQPLVS